MWIARDKNRQLYAYPEEPVRDELAFNGWDCMGLKKDEFPEVTWENSPVEIKSIPKNWEE